MSGLQDSNLRPPAPKAGALTGLRQTPNKYFSSFKNLKNAVQKWRRERDSNPRYPVEGTSV